MRHEFFIILGLYLVLVIFLGLRFSQRMKNLEDFFLASRRLSAWLVFLSLTASWFGATSILVTTDEAHRIGVSAICLVGVPAILTVLVFAFFLAGSIRRFPILTLPDLIEQRYGKVVRHMTSFLLFWYLVVLASSQMVAVGQFFRPFLGMPYVWSLGLGTGVVLIYLVSGGLRSVAVTDSFQCVLLTSGVVGLGVFILRVSSFKAAAETAVPAFPSGYLNIFLDSKRNLLIVLSFTLAWIISPVAWQRIQAARTEKNARQGLLLCALAFAFLYGLVVGIGILARPLFPSAVLSSPLMSEIIASKAPPFLGAILFVAVAAAILSTMDTVLNTGALTLTRDIYEQFFRRGAELRRPVLVGRMTTFLVTALAFALATQFQSILKTIGLASAVMAEGLFVPGVAMFLIKKKMPFAGALSLTLGGGFALASFLSELRFFPINLPTWPDSVPYGVGLSLLGYALGFLLEKFRGRTMPFCSFQ